MMIDRLIRLVQKGRIDWTGPRQAGPCSVPAAVQPG